MKRIGQIKCVLLPNTDNFAGHVPVFRYRPDWCVSSDCSLHGDVYSTYLRYVRLKPLQLSKGPPFSSLLEVTMQYKRCCPWILTCTPQFLEITPVSIMQDAAHSGRDNLSARILSISFRCSSSLKRLKIKRLLFITSETLVTLKDK